MLRPTRILDEMAPPRPDEIRTELTWLVREKGVELINHANENPSLSPKACRAFLEALIATGAKATIIGSFRADDIVRDKDILHLCKKAGCRRLLTGLECTDEATLQTVKQGGTRAKDRQAFTLLRQHAMIGLSTFAVGLDEETDAAYRRLLSHFLRPRSGEVGTRHSAPLAPVSSLIRTTPS